MDDDFLPVNVICISSVRPQPTGGGEIILYRHLADRPDIRLTVYGSEVRGYSLPLLLRRLVGKLRRTPLKKFCEDLWCLWEGRWLDACLPKRVDAPERTVILTMAHGDVCHAALRFAKRHDVPLVTVFHDFWPDMVHIHARLKPRLERQFRRLYAESSAALCVSEGMRDTLGRHAKAFILPPIPADCPPAERNRIHSSQPFKICYFGNLGDYGPMLGDALQASLDNPELFLQVRGKNPQWPEPLKQDMAATGRWLDFAPRSTLDQWLAEADAFLVPMVFAPSMRRRMETCFPSKLIEYARYGKPLVIWGPEYCSAIRWAMNGDNGLCVTSPNPRSLVSVLSDLAASPAKQRYFEEKSREAGMGEFHPEGIQAQFIQILQECVGPRGSTGTICGGGQ